MVQIRQRLSLTSVAKPGLAWDCHAPDSGYTAQAMRDFADLPISIKKAELAVDEMDALFDRRLYEKLIRENRESLREILRARETGINNHFLDYLRTHTRVNWALDLREVLSNHRHAPFLDNSDRLSRSGTYSRGYTYIVSIDKGLTGTEILAVFKKDLCEAVPCLTNCASELEAFVISDYVKNAIITMLNALLSEEKIGLYRIDDDEYQSVRTEFVELASLAVRFHYQFCFNDSLFKLPDNYQERTERVLSYLEKRAAQRYYRLPDASLSRPEASHPLVIFYSSLKLASAYPKAQTVVGIPSGGSELALVIELQYNHFYGHTLQSVLFPASFHSMKDVYGEQRTTATGMDAFLHKHRDKFFGRNVVICDDNSSTGRTLQYVQDSLAPLIGPGLVAHAVAEIDIT